MGNQCMAVDWEGTGKGNAVVLHMDRGWALRHGAAMKDNVFW